MANGPQDPVARGAAAGGHLRASDADREQAIETLKSAFIQGRLNRNDLGRRAGQALEARTYAELARATGGIPAVPAAPRPPSRPAAPAPGNPANWKVIGCGLGVLILSPALGVAFVTTYYGGFIILFLLAFIGLTAVSSHRPSKDGRPTAP